MSDVCAAFSARLLAHAGTAALVGTRVDYSFLPENPTYPFITLQKISVTPEPCFGADADKEQARVQVDVWAAKRSSAILVAAQMRAALKRWTGTAGGVTVAHSALDTESEAWEDDVKVWRIRQDYLVWYIA